MRNNSVPIPGRAGYMVSWICGHDETVYVDGGPLDARGREALILHTACHCCPDCRSYPTLQSGPSVPNPLNVQAMFW